MEAKDYIDHFFEQTDIGDSKQWIDELYGAFLKRTGLPAESACLIVERDPDTGQECISYKAIIGFNEDGTPIMVQRLPLPSYLWEYGRRMLEANPILKPAAALVAAGVVAGVTLLMTRGRD